MPWMECDQMCLRREFVGLASVEGANVSALCRRFGISRKTGYKWLGRYRSEGCSGLSERSRRPAQMRSATPALIEQQVLAVRAAHRAWGGRKIRRVLLNGGHEQVPAASTITAILRRHGRIDAAESAKRGPVQRFERAWPNELWQMDFKGEFKMVNGRWCYPLTVLDDQTTTDGQWDVYFGTHRIGQADLRRNETGASSAVVMLPPYARERVEAP